MQTFSKLRRNISYKVYLDYFGQLAGAFILALLSSSFLLFPILIAFVMTRYAHRTFFPVMFLYFTEITHSLPMFSLIIFFYLFNLYIHSFLTELIHKTYVKYVSVALIYGLLFLIYRILDILLNTSFDISSLMLFYYVLFETLLVVFFMSEGRVRE